MKIIMRCMNIISPTTPHIIPYHTPHYPLPHPTLSPTTPHTIPYHTPHYPLPHPTLSPTTPHTISYHTPYYPLPPAHSTTSLILHHNDFLHFTLQHIPPHPHHYTLPHHTLLHHTTSHLTQSHPTTLHHATLVHTTSYHTPSHFTTPHPITSHPNTPHHTHLENSTLPLVHRATKFVKPMPYLCSLVSSLAFIGSGMSEDKYKHFPEGHVVGEMLAKGDLRSLTSSRHI